MKGSWKLLILAVVVTLATAPRMSAQANVNESLETSTLYVDEVNGSDNNPGTQQQPLQTITTALTKAVENNQAGIGTKVIANPGVYREDVNLTGNAKDTSMPITLEAAVNGTAVLSGADVWTGWQPSAFDSEIYTHPWPYQWGLCQPLGEGAPYQEDITLRREMIFVDGVPMTQVLSLSQVVFPGSFYVDEPGKTVYLLPPSGVDISQAQVEVATRAQVFWLTNKSNWVIRGMTFADSASCRTDHPIEIGGTGSNVLFDSDEFLWNNAGGVRFDFPFTNFTLENSVALHNGSVGFGDFHTKYGLYTNDRTSYNNWRGAQGSYYTWGSAGAYFFSQHDSTVTDMNATYNETNGIHWDTDNADVTGSNMFVAQNLVNGIFIEKNEGPMTISDNYFCNNSNANAVSAGAVQLRNSTYITLTGNTLYDSGTTELNVVGQAGGIVVQNWETGQTYNLITSNITMSQNVFDSIGSGVQVFRDIKQLGGTDWTDFQTTLASDNNTWWNADDTGVFTTPSLLAQKFSYWQSVTGQDAHSTFAAPSTDPSGACQSTPDDTDFWVISDTTLQTASSNQVVAHITIVPLAFSGPVQLEAMGPTNLPGVSFAFSQNIVQTSGTSTLTVSTKASTPAGIYPITVLANSGDITHTLTFSVVVPGTNVPPPTDLVVSVY